MEAVGLIYIALRMCRFKEPLWVQGWLQDLWCKWKIQLPFACVVFCCFFFLLNLVEEILEKKNCDLALS